MSPGLRSAASIQPPKSSTQNGWPSVATTVPVRLPLSPSVSKVISTMFLSPSPMMSAATGRASVLPVLGSVATTWSPTLTFAMALCEPSAIRTGVSGVKLLIGHDGPSLPALDGVGQGDGAGAGLGFGTGAGWAFGGVPPAGLVVGVSFGLGAARLASAMSSPASAMLSPWRATVRAASTALSPYRTAFAALAPYPASGMAEAKDNAAST